MARRTHRRLDDTRAGRPAQRAGDGPAGIATNRATSRDESPENGPNRRTGHEIDRDQT